METLNEILELWNSDADIDQTEPGKELLKIPKLHNKYLTILTKHKMASKRCNFDYLRMRKTKWEYYSGKMDQEELDKYGWDQFRYTLKSDISTYLESDNDLIKLLEKKIYHEETVSVIESIMGELKQRTWQLRDYITWERFIGGN
jgi:Recombination, repair and ssDNA binding protein UvsY